VTTPRPPRVAAWLIGRLRADSAEYLLGDLLEDFSERTRGQGGVRASLWFWRETIVALWALGVTRRAPKTHARPADGWLQGFLLDLQLAARVLRRSPAFVVVCVATLAVGIGATATIFSVVNPLLVESLPYPHAARLMMVWERGDDGLPSGVGYASVADLAERTRTLERVAAVGDWRPTLGAGAPEQVAGARVSASYFRLLGVNPFLGRDFAPEEDSPARNQVVVLSFGLWKRRFGGDRAIVGRAITINGGPVTVVGVMPEGFDDVVSPGTEIWRVLGYDASLPYACRTCRHLRLVAQLRADVPRQVAARELNDISAQMVAAHPKEYSAAGMFVVPLQTEVTGPYRSVLLAISAAVGLILLIATANVVNLQIARSIRRRTEFAVRGALGAGRRHLARQLLAEGVWLAGLGGVGGFIVTWLTLPLLVRELPPALPRLAAIHVDTRVCAFVTVLVLAIALAISLAPAARRDLVSGFEPLRSIGAVASRAQRGTRRVLVAGEFALALTLLVGAGLVGRSLLRVFAVEMGFDPHPVLSLALTAVGPAYDADAATYAYHDRVLAAVRSVPGVIDAGIANQLPLTGNVDRYGVEALDKPLANPELAPSADRYVVTARFLETMQIPLLRGRSFERVDFIDSASKVVLVSRSLAERLWPGEDALGKRIRMGGSTTPWRSVIGITRDIHHYALDAAEAGQFYVPERQWPWAASIATIVVRTAGDPASMAPIVRRVVAAVDPTLPISRVATMDQVVTRSTALRRLAVVLFCAFAAMALLLAVAGIYGVLAASVAERTREIGVRSALGAAPERILRMVLLEGMWVASVGCALGLGGAFLLTRFLGTLLFEIRPMDPLTLSSVCAILALVSLVACLVPGWRAVRIDPISALRSE